MSLVRSGVVSLSEILRRSSGPKDNKTHCRAAIDWLAAAQDACEGGGVSSSYNVRDRRWSAPYPETTGYIIPTMLDYCHLVGDQDYRVRALRMADWEISVQMESGAVQGRELDAAEKKPVVFNTGQVLIGLARVYRETNDDRYLEAAVKGANWLLANQDEDGAWRRHLSAFTKTPVQTYNTRTALGLLQVHQMTSNEIYRECATKNIEWALTQQLDNGWFENNAFVVGEAPLLHTISYAIEGILESGIYLDNEEYIGAAKKSADALLQLQRPDGTLYGRYDSRWKPTVSWSCLTGDAQVSVVWGMLYQLTGDTRYLGASRRMNTYLKQTQDLDSKDHGVRGGIKGSQPIWGGYFAFCYLNWATKFFADALILQEKIEKASGGAS